MGVLDEHAACPVSGAGLPSRPTDPASAGLSFAVGALARVQRRNQSGPPVRQRAELDHREDPCPFNFSSNTSRGSGTIVSRSDMDGRFSSER